MKKLLEGQQIRGEVPQQTVQGDAPCVRLQHGLLLDDANCWQYPTLLVGSVGSGKSSLMETFQETILRHAEQQGDTVVIFAAKPTALKVRRPGDPVIAVSSTEPACCWNLFRELDASEVPELTLREIAEALFAEAKRKSNQVFFPEAAQDWFYQTARFMYEQGKESGANLSNEDLLAVLCRTPISEPEKQTGWLELAERYPMYFSALRDYIGDGSAQGAGVLSELRTMISRTFYGSFAEEGTFSALQAVRQGGKRIFLYYEYDRAHSALPLFKLILDLMLQQSLSGTMTHKTWFLLDEFSQLPKLEHLVDVLAIGRDPSGSGCGGVRLMAAVQSVQLLTRHYSELEAKTLASLFPNLISLRVMDPMTRAAMSDRYGTARVIYRYAGEGNRLVSTDTDQKVVTDADFSALLKPGQAIMSLPGVCAEPFFYDGWRP